MMRWLIPLAAFTLSATASFTQTAQPLRATLRITVVDAIGNPVPEATVNVQPLDVPMGMVLPSCRTGPEGKCAISKLELLRYEVFASKPLDGYPEHMYSFFNVPGAPRSIVTFSAGHIEDDVVVPIGKKGGILKGTVTDAETGKGLNANVEFRWVSNPQIFFSGSGLANAQFRIVVPSGTAFTMVISLDGFEAWTYTSPSTPAKNSIQLNSGEELTLDIRLRPKRAHQASPAAPRI
jgi:hypothetical protein